MKYREVWCNTGPGGIWDENREEDFDEENAHDENKEEEKEEKEKEEVDVLEDKEEYEEGEVQSEKSKNRPHIIRLGKN